MVNDPVFIDFSHSKITRIIDFFYPEHRMRTIDDFMNIVFANRITQHDKHFFTINNAARKTYGMTDSLPVGLMNKMSRKLGILLTDVILYLLAQVTYNKNKFPDTGIIKLIHNNAQNCSASQWN